MSFQATHLIGFGSRRVVSGTPTLIPQGNGTLIGNMTNNGGLAAAFDGTSAQAQAAAAVSPSGEGTVGKDYGSGVTHNVTRWKVWGCTDVGFNNQPVNGACDVFIQYSDDGSAWTQADTVNINALPGTIDRTFASVGAHRYWRVRINDGAADGRCAEVEFYA